MVSQQVARLAHFNVASTPSRREHIVNTESTETYEFAQLRMQLQHQEKPDQQMKTMLHNQALATDAFQQVAGGWK